MKGLQIELLEKSSEFPFDLLLLADPSAEMISKYIEDCQIFIASLNEELIGCYALLPIDEILIEIKNIAVCEQYQGKGIGTILIKDAIEKSKDLGFKKLRIGTGNSSLGQLHLYKKLGFNLKEVVAGFFRDNYQKSIFENEMECVDLIVLERRLTSE